MGILSAGCEYAIRAMLFLEGQPGNHSVPVAVIAHETGISHPFLSKVVRQLVRRGLLESARGPGGGVRLVRPASEISLLDVIAAIDGLHFSTGCALGFPECDDEVPCPVHPYWKSLRGEVMRMFAKKSLSAFAREIAPKLRKYRRGRRTNRRAMLDFNA